MLKDRDIICISSIDWDFIWQGHQEIMSTLAKNGNRVLFIENTGARRPCIKDASRIRSRIKNWLKGIRGMRKEADNLYVFSPLALPFPYSRIILWINRRMVMPVLNRWMKVMDFSDPIVWTFLPTPLSIDIADNISKKLLIYYCIDNFSVSSVSAGKIKKSEDRLLKKADMVFVTSKELYNRCSVYNQKIYKFPFAVNFKEFEKTRIGNSIFPAELKDIQTPIIGYVGGVHKWVDQDLVKYLAEKCPKYSFIFVGPLQADVSELSNFKNVYFLGKKQHEDLPLFIKHFDACIIPYLITEYTKNVYPTKLNEYLALGKPVISTHLPEIEEFSREYGDVVYMGGDKERFKELIDKAIEEDSQLLRNKRIDAASNNSWENRIEKMSRLIEGEIENKKNITGDKWKENLVNFYRIARKKMWSLVISCILIYLLLFKTAFLWFAASPLKISDVPQKADVILVFGGGVGETGSPGKSTMERARYAAELYKKGYSDKIIFSSGYAYNYNDADNMKLFAMSMGVPEKDIILEKKANSAYENVKFSEEILRSNGWGSGLLISAPYNMRRVQMVFNRSGGNIKIFYTPVKNSQFYDRSEGVKLEQIKAVAHEYFGIAYYWFKGRI